MRSNVSRSFFGALAVSVVALISAATGSSDVVAAGTTPDSLTLLQPQNIKARSEYSAFRRSFRVFVTWDDFPDSCATYIHPPDTTGWSLGVAPGTVSMPSSRGTYVGDTDRTLTFLASTPGFAELPVGGPETIVLNYAVRKEEHINGTIFLDASYVPGTWIHIDLENEADLGNIFPVELGVWVKFDAGVIATGRTFNIGLEDFEGYHIWRGIESDGSDLQIIGEISKQEAFLGNRTGGSLPDFFYFYLILPALRESGTWFSPIGPIDCLGSRITLDLEPDGMFWFDCNASNGFTYYYTVTAFDRDYTVASARQGLFKVDSCSLPDGGPFECTEDLFPLSVEVDAGSSSDMMDIYAVPNPFRSGGSRLVRENYRNFPDDKIRFVNVPVGATLRIFTVSGDLVWEKMDHEGPNGNIEWDVTNRDQQSVTSGVYIYRVVSATGESMFGRVVVIR